MFCTACNDTGKLVFLFLLYFLLKAPLVFVFRVKNMSAMFQLQFVSNVFVIIDFKRVMPSVDEFAD